MLTQHASRRAKDRGIPPLVLQWLEEHGAEAHVGQGTRVLWFDKPARRRIERTVGREPVRRMHEWMDAYAVVGNDGQTITCGHRRRRIKR